MKTTFKWLVVSFIAFASVQLNYCYGQVTFPGNLIVPADYVGTGNLNDLNLVTQFGQNINFHTNGGAVFPWANQKMQITTNANPLLDGFVGIGNSNVAVGTVFQPAGTFPNHKFDVDGGDINVNLVNQGYRIGAGVPWSPTSGGNSYWVLWHGPNPTQANAITNIYVGARAGLSSSNTCNNNTPPSLASRE